jgi:DNA polymerase III psi subunit
VTLQDFINALTGLATTMVPAATIGIIVVAGAVVSGAAMLLRRVLRAGR